MPRNDNELARAANGLTFEPHRIRFDRTGRYEEPLDREFPFIIKLFRFKHREITPGLTWHERLELFVPLDGVVRMRMGDRVAEVGKGEILIVVAIKIWLLRSLADKRAIARLGQICYAIQLRA
jgi:hypothetical protein